MDDGIIVISSITVDVRLPKSSFVGPVSLFLNEGPELQIVLMVFPPSRAVANVFTNDDFPAPHSPTRIILMNGTTFVISEVKLLNKSLYSVTTYMF